jgi:hypothetical protein
MTQYKYYLADNGLGVPHEIYRGAPTYERFFDSGVQRAKKDGSWSADTSETRWLMNLWQTGDFDPRQDEVSEAKALSQLDAWRQSGTWPGRE